jgi:thiol peroxidase
MTPTARAVLRLAASTLLVCGLVGCQAGTEPGVAAEAASTAEACPPGTEGIEQSLGALPERAGEVTLRGEGLTLVGPPVEVGQPAPEFVAVAQDMSEQRLEDYSGRILVLSSVPSLDTGVCSRQTKTFNEKAAELGDEVAIVTLSMDLPFAQKRWCGAEGVEEVETLSDYRHWSFGLAWGLRIQESGLLARAVHVVDRDGVVRYRQIVPELTQEPDYAPVLSAVQDLLAP